MGKCTETVVRFWKSDAGPKTIFFWAPFFKWSLVLANVSDLWRPAKDMSFWQNLSLMMTGLIWSRYSTVIIPINWYLFSVNIFVGITGAYQTGRAAHYQYFVKPYLNDTTNSTDVTTIATTLNGF